jgi:peptide/nickel transport system substrate-binding protein
VLRKEELSVGRRAALRGCCGVFLCSLLLTACGTIQSEPRPTRETLTLGFPEGARSRAKAGVNQVVEALTLEGLTKVAADGRAEPRIATRWEWSPDGLTLHVQLRQDVLLHDGRRLNSKLAAEILKAIVANPENHDLFTSLADVTAVEPEGDFGLALTVSRHTSYLPEDLSIPFGTSSEPPIGTGPYHVVEQANSEFVLERFDHYYLGRPTIPRVKVLPVETMRTAWTSFLRGDLDMVADLPPDAVELVRNDDIQVLSFSRPYQYLVAFNSKHPKLSNPTVRRALNMAIDRDSIVNNVLHGNGTPATTPIWPKHWAYDPTVELSFDRHEAARMLDSAGLSVRPSTDPRKPPSRLRITCILPAGFSIYERVALELQHQLYEIRVDLQFDVVPFEVYNKRTRAGDFEATFVDMISAPSLGRPYLFWRSAREGRGYNVFGYENPEAEALFQTLRASTNDQSVRSATHRLQRVFLQDPPAIFLAWNERSRAVRREFGVPVADAAAKTDPLLSLWRWGADKRSETPIAR